MRWWLPLLLAGCASGPEEKTLPPPKKAVVPPAVSEGPGVAASERHTAPGADAQTRKPSDAPTPRPSDAPTPPSPLVLLGGDAGVYRQLLARGVLFEPRKDADGEAMIGGRVSSDGKDIRLEVVVYNRGPEEIQRARVTVLATIYRADGTTRPLTASTFTRDLASGERRRVSVRFAYGEPDVPGEPRTLVMDVGKCRVGAE